MDKVEPLGYSSCVTLVSLCFGLTYSWDCECFASSNVTTICAWLACGGSFGGLVKYGAEREVKVNVFCCSN